jgi:hypothetical protein
MTKKIDFLDAQELLLHILNIDEDEFTNDDVDYVIEQALYQEFGIDVDQLLKLLNVLVPLIDVARSPITKTLYKGFGNDGFWMLKIPV